MPFYTIRVTAVRSVEYAPVLVETKDKAAAWNQAHEMRWRGELMEISAVDGTATVRLIDGASHNGCPVE